MTYNVLSGTLNPTVPYHIPYLSLNRQQCRQSIVDVLITWENVLMFTEPNNDSPLNAQAAELWSNQDTYKRVLLERYERDTK